MLGTPHYMCPEIVCEEEYDHRCDTWSIGILTYVLLCGVPPFNSEANDRDELDEMIVNDDMVLPEAMDGKLTGPCVEFMMKCLIKEQDKRPEARQMLEHSWIAEVAVKIVSHESQLKVVDQLLSQR